MKRIDGLATLVSIHLGIKSSRLSGTLLSARLVQEKDGNMKFRLWEIYMGEHGLFNLEVESGSSLAHSHWAGRQRTTVTNKLDRNSFFGRERIALFSRRTLRIPVILNIAKVGAVLVEISRVQFSPPRRCP